MDINDEIELHQYTNILSPLGKKKKQHFTSSLCFLTALNFDDILI